MKGNELRDWRKNKCYTQDELAKALGVHTMTISKWETGARQIPPFLRLALEALGQKGGEKGSRDTKTKRKGGKGNG